MSVDDLLWKAGIGLGVLLVARLVSVGLFAEYRALVVYVAFGALRDLALFLLARDERWYAEVYVFSTPVVWFLAILVVLDIYSKVLQGYRGLSFLTRRTLVWSLLVSSFGALVFVLLSIQREGEPYPHLRLVFAFEQAVSLTLFFFLSLIAVFLLWYPLPLKRNLLIYSFGYAGVLVAYAAAMALRNVAGHGYTRMASTIVLATYAACLFFWTVRMNVRGEAEVRTAAIPRGEAEEQRLLGQLSAMNALLEGGRKG